VPKVKASKGAYPIMLMKNTIDGPNLAKADALKLKDWNKVHIDG
jgi:hypothetical protein